jgi:formate hydrogenlyase subunit 3/multisubunit Na+/H+ antiporter MnhD subunit
VSQLSYVVLGSGALASTSAVMLGGAVQIAHARGRQDHALLLRRRHLHRRAQDRDQQLDGIGRTMPWTMFAFTLIGALSH